MKFITFATLLATSNEKLSHMGGVIDYYFVENEQDELEIFWDNLSNRFTRDLATFLITFLERPTHLQVKKFQTSGISKLWRLTDDQFTQMQRDIVMSGLHILAWRCMLSEVPEDKVLPLRELIFFVDKKIENRPIYDTRKFFTEMAKMQLQLGSFMDNHGIHNSLPEYLSVSEKLVSQPTDRQIDACANLLTAIELMAANKSNQFLKQMMKLLDDNLSGYFGCDKRSASTHVEDADDRNTSLIVSILDSFPFETESSDSESSDSENADFETPGFKLRLVILLTIILGPHSRLDNFWSKFIESRALVRQEPQHGAQFQNRQGLFGCIEHKTQVDNDKVKDMPTPQGVF